MSGKLKWAGNVGTGFDRKTMKTIYDKLAPLAIDKCPLEPDKNLPKKDVTWVRPELVCEVKFANWTEDGRLRAPVWMGFRTDIDPSEVVARTVTIRREARDAARSVASRGEPDHRRAPAEVHQSQQGLLSQGRLSQARSAELLRRRRAADPAASERPPAFAQALSQRHRRAVLLSEGSRRELSQVAAHRHGRRHSFT